MCRHVNPRRHECDLPRAVGHHTAGVQKEGLEAGAVGAVGADAARAAAAAGAAHVRASSAAAQ